MAAQTSPSGSSQNVWLIPEEMEVIDNPAGLRISFRVPEDFYRSGRSEKDRALAAAGAEMSTSTAQTAAGWDASASLISITLEFLAEAIEGPIIGTGTISRMGANIAFVGGQIMAGDQLCLRATGSCRIENKFPRTRTLA